MTMHRIVNNVQCIRRHFLLKTYFVTRVIPMHYIDSKGHKSELRSNRNYLTNHEVQIMLLVIYSLGGGGVQTHTCIHTHDSDFKKPGACSPAACVQLKKYF